MRSVIIDIGIIIYILNSQYEKNSIYLITRFNEQRDCRYWTVKRYLESKIYLIPPFHEQGDYRYWTITIYFDLNIKNNFNIFKNEVP